MSKIPFILMLFFFAATTVLQAQQTQLKDWQRAKSYTLAYMEAMPSDKFDYKPTSEVRSFATQLLHLTDANYAFVSAALGVESPVAHGVLEQTTDTSKEHVIQLVSEGYDFVIKHLKEASEEDLSKTITLFGRFELTAQEAIDKAFEHQTHHRGQTTLYLRLAGVTPPAEQLF